MRCYSWGIISKEKYDKIMKKPLILTAKNASTEIAGYGLSVFYAGPEVMASFIFTIRTGLPRGTLYEMTFNYYLYNSIEK